jgi:mannose-6-phosphate isomerase-like protein (cupin superfamily)
VPPEPLLLAPGAGEVVADRPGRRVLIKCVLDGLVVTESHLGGGEPGTDPHVHREHADCFYVLDGEVTFELGEGEIVHGHAGDFVLVPPNVVHCFRNDSPDPISYLNMHAPGGGFGEYMRGEAEGFDSFDPPADGGLRTSLVVHSRAGEGDRLAAGQASALVKGGAGNGMGSLAAVEVTAPPGYSGPPPHFHSRTAESFFVLEGAITLHFGERAEEVPAGSFVVVPPGVVHTSSNPRPEPVRALNMLAPAGLERLMAEAAGGTPLEELARRHDIVLA